MSADAHAMDVQPLLPERLENARSLLVVLSLMAFLAGLALLFSRGATRLSDDWRAQLSDTATVQVLHNSPETREAQMSAAAELLRRLLPDADISIMSEPDAAALLEPWLGATRLPDDLPVPGLITIKNMAGNMSTGQITTQMEAEGLLVNIDNHDRYATGVKRTSQRLIILGSGLLIILLTAGLAVSVFATRAGLSAQRDIISVLVQVGASNRFIAKLFVGQAGRRGILGALIGLTFAALFWSAASIVGVTGEMGWHSVGAVLRDVLWLIGLGLLFTTICAMAAGLTATRQMARERRRA
ncbi:cell division protein FtsX [Litorimonas sp. RW-G-Af-16]|uniref:cell division protein FtsX n=1 Tax=Litorimonas sp. RW-G-Af-16 TaxID=3241168 RepID=UPI00390C9D40